MNAATAELSLVGERVLLIVPDSTRTCPMGPILRAINAAWRNKVAIDHDLAEHLGLKLGNVIKRFKHSH